MKVLIVDQSEIRRRLPMHECMDVMSAALARGDAILPLRPIMHLPRQPRHSIRFAPRGGAAVRHHARPTARDDGRHGDHRDPHRGRERGRHARARAAVPGADIICTTTAAKERVLRGEWIAPGTHINAAGARSEGAITDAHIVGEIGELLLGAVRGRRSAEEITLFKSLGLAVEDLAAADHIYKEGDRGGRWRARRARRRAGR